MPKIKPAINYTSREFSSIRADLESYVKRYYPNTFRDFTEASFGSLMLDTISYVGDMLSFYVDYQTNESFLDTAMEFDNVLKLSRELGYKYSPNPSSYGFCNFYITIPTEPDGPGPDSDYMPILRKGSTFYSTSNALYTLLEDVDFSLGINPIVSAEQDETNATPLSYAVRASGQVISGELAVQEVPIGEYQKFLRIAVDGANISEIVTVYDDNGNQYYEVDYLSQDIIHVPVLNKGSDSQTVPFILKPVSVSRRFRTEYSPDGCSLQFGHGNQETPIEVKDPSEVILNIHGKNYVTDTSFDPSILNKTDKLGVVPSDTILTIIYRINTTENTNAAANSINSVASAQFQFNSPEGLDEGKMSSVRNSMAVLNESPITGDVSIIPVEELKERAIGNFASQNRAVTKQDYVSMVYNMPSKYGKIKRVAIELDNDSYNQRNINLYVLSEDTDQFFTQSSNTLKNNLKTWINEYKMINDTIDILDAKISNFGIIFEVVAFPGSNKYDVLNECNRALQAAYDKTYDIGEPIIVTDVYQILKSVPDLLDVAKVSIVIKSGSEYADSPMSIEEARSINGRFVVPPIDTIFEMKFPESDIVGTVT